MFKIGDFSKLSRISIRMLRHYNEIGLLVPEQIDDFTSYRYYSAEQLSTSSRIQSLKSMGFSLSVIKNILNDYDDSQKLKQYLEIHISQLQKDEKTIQEQILMIKTTIERIGKDDIIMNYNITIKEFPEMYVMSLRKIIPTYHDEGIVWSQMKKETENMDIKYNNPCNAIAVFFDEGYKESDVDVEAQISVLGKYKDTKNVCFKIVPSVTAVTTIVKGDFSQLTKVCESIGKWISDNKYEFDGAMFNIYHVSPAMDDNPDNWVTEVCFPVKKK